MRFLEKLSLVVFSLIIFVLSIIVFMLFFNFISLNTINVALLNVLTNETSARVTFGIAIVLIILSLRNIFGASGENEENKYGSDGILLKNDNGTLLISRETLENLVSNIANSFEGTQNVNTRVILDKENNLSVHITLHVEENTVIKDLSSKLQTRIKDAIKETSDLDVKEVNIQVRNITSQEIKKLPEK